MLAAARQTIAISKQIGDLPLPSSRQCAPAMTIPGLSLHPSSVTYGSSFPKVEVHAENIRVRCRISLSQTRCESGDGCLQGAPQVVGEGVLV